MEKIIIEFEEYPNIIDQFEIEHKENTYFFREDCEGNLIIMKHKMFLNYDKKINSKQSGKEYIIHNNDPDPLPSNPHIHVDDRKICINTREYFYNAKRTGIKMGKKDFTKLLKDFIKKSKNDDITSRPKTL